MLQPNARFRLTWTNSQSFERCKNTEMGPSVAMGDSYSTCRQRTTVAYLRRFQGILLEFQSAWSAILLKYKNITASSRKNDILPLNHIQHHTWLEIVLASHCQTGKFPNSLLGRVLRRVLPQLWETISLRSCSGLAWQIWKARCRKIKLLPSNLTAS